MITIIKDKNNFFKENEMALTFNTMFSEYSYLIFHLSRSPCHDIWLEVSVVDKVHAMSWCLLVCPLLKLLNQEKETRLKNNQVRQMYIIKKIWQQK